MIDPYSVFVGQLNPDIVTKEAVLERFGKYGDVLDCNLVVKPGKFGELNTLSKCDLKAYSVLIGLGRTAFAFIKYDDHLSATRAIDQEVRPCFPRYISTN